MPHGNRFLIMANKFFVARNQPKGKDQGSAVNLMVCEPSLSSFIPVEMPVEAADLKHHGFTVVDTSEFGGYDGSVSVDPYHPSRTRRKSLVGLCSLSGKIRLWDF